METVAIFMGIMALTLAGVTLHAWRLGNEKRDVALLGAFGAFFGVGATATALL